MTLAPLYIYAATVASVHDGDSVRLNVDRGFREWWLDQPFRLAACNARELREPGGKEARDHLAALLPPGTKVLLQSIKADEYGNRYDAEITLPDGRDLVDVLCADGWAAPWDGRGERPVPPWPRATP